MKSIYWMHIQKTSSWIGNLLLVWACPAFCSFYLQQQNISYQAYRNRSIEYSLMIESYHVPSNKDFSLSLTECNKTKTSKNKISSKFDYYRNFDNLYFKSYHSDGPTALTLEQRSAIMNCSVDFRSNGLKSSFPIGQHNPYNDPNMNHSVISLFRLPLSRIISSYLFNIMIPQGVAKTRGVDSVERIKDRIRASSEPILEYIKIPGILSCQTKMLIGHHCGEVLELSEDHLIEAKRRLRYDLYFFGLTEESEATANLFLALHYEDGGLPYRKSLDELIYPPFVFLTRRVNEQHTTDTHAMLMSELEKVGYSDFYDEALYREACELFYEKCKTYNILTLYDSCDHLQLSYH